MKKCRKCNKAMELKASELYKAHVLTAWSCKSCKVVETVIVKAD